MIADSKIAFSDLIEDGSEGKLFRVHKRLFRDPDVFDAEMERIFEREWVYVAYETEVAHGGDYKTTYIGRQPVIVTRHSDDGEVHVLYNSCRHRGAAVCQQESGNANFFRCGYHGWVYNNRGENVSVPDKEGYDEDFDQREWGLIPVPRVANYAGFIFASLSPTGPSLEEHLGNARQWLDLFTNISPQGILVRSDVIHKSAYEGNWKFQLENPNDGYHFDTTHHSILEVRRRRPGGEAVTAARGERRAFNSRGALALGNGHCASDFNFDPAAYAERLKNLTQVFPPTAIFPNLVIIDVQIRHIIPRAHNRTDLWVHPVTLKDVPDVMNAQRMRKQEDFYGSAGFGAPDDWEQFERVQKGAYATGNEWLLYARGLRDEVEDPETGIRWTPNVRQGSEVTLRGIYRHWKQLMAKA